MEEINIDHKQNKILAIYPVYDPVDAYQIDYQFHHYLKQNRIKNYRWIMKKLLIK